MVQYPRIQPINDSNILQPVREVATLFAGDVVGVDGLFTAVALTIVVDTPVPSGFGATTNE